MNLTEKQIEDVFEIFHSELIEENLKLIKRQHIFDNRLRADLLFEDEKGITVIVELKKTPISREDIGQLLEYHGMFETPKTRVILASPFIPETIRKSFEHFGIEYIQFSLTDIQDFYNKIMDIPKEKVKNQVEVPKTILTRPLNEKLIDGNIAFKITYNDEEWQNVCSKDVAEYNFKHRTWCKIQSTREENCQNPIWNELISKNQGAPCYDCVSLKTLSFTPGHFHGEKHNNEPKRCLNAKKGKFALFTSKEPGATEMDRFVFLIGQISDFDLDEEVGTERIGCDFEKFIYFPNNYFKFWKYFRNLNTERIAWNTGLFRYVDDKTIRLMLEDIIKESKLDKEDVETAKLYLEMI
jgi:hypothetical protein